MSMVWKNGFVKKIQVGTPLLGTVCVDQLHVRVPSFSRMFRRSEKLSGGVVCHLGPLAGSQ